MRAHYLDSLRGLAVVWMMIFHFSYDLKMFGMVDWNFNQGFWFAFPRVIAFTFLFCVGLSLYFGHGEKVKWNLIGKRTLKIGGAALIISLATYNAFPDRWIYFGTLHCIAVGSVLGALVVRHQKISFTLLIFILTGQYLAGFDIRWVSSIIQKPSMDFIPIYPWFWAILLGIILAPHLSRISLLNKMKPIPFLALLGRHSLKIYLVHQPVFYGVIWIFSLIRKS